MPEGGIQLEAAVGVNYWTVFMDFHVKWQVIISSHSIGSIACLKLLKVACLFGQIYCGIKCKTIWSAVQPVGWWTAN